MIKIEDNWAKALIYVIIGLLIVRDLFELRDDA
jgi:hypothetical protein